MEEKDGLLMQLGRVVEMWEIINRAYQETLGCLLDGNPLAGANEAPVEVKACEEFMEMMNPLLAQVEDVIKRLMNYHWLVDETVIAARLNKVGVDFSAQATDEVKAVAMAAMVKAVKQIFEDSPKYEVKREEV